MREGEERGERQKERSRVKSVYMCTRRAAGRVGKREWETKW